MFAISTVDEDWFEHIRREAAGRVINFWKPTPRPIRQLRHGDRVYFMRKAPMRQIAGYGKFVRWRQMSAKDAWKEYGSGNGVDSEDELIRKLESYAERRSKNFIRTGNPAIGCIELVNITILRRSVTAEECGLHFPSNYPGLKYFRGSDAIETHSNEPLELDL